MYGQEIVRFLEEEVSLIQRFLGQGYYCI